ncbi:MAG TPA: hypothetical protein VFV52_00215 [Bacilli bacterium]|nr:hypothetical protein [Bacilli bacterium]
MVASRLRRLALSAVVMAMSSTLVVGCNTVGGGQAKVQSVELTGAAQPLSSADLQTFEDELFRQLNVSANQRRDFRILDTANVENGTYILYALPNNDALAFAQRGKNGRVVIREARWTFAVTDDNSDPVVVKAVPPGNAANPKYGILAGRVYNPYIESIEVNYRDGKKMRQDVTHTRGFIFVRKAFDTRFVQVRGYGMNGNPYWSIDTR